MDKHRFKWKLLGIILFSIICFPSIAKASMLTTPRSEINSPLRIMLPAPHMLEKAKSQNGLVGIKEMYSKMQERNKSDKVLALPPGGAGMRKSGSIIEKSSTPVQPTAKALAIAVQFTDKKATTEISYFQNMLFGSSFGTMSDYYRTVSDGNFVLEGKVVGLSQDTVFITLPHEKNYYAYNSYGCDGSYPHNAQGLVADAVQALISANFDWTPYKDSAGAVPYLFVIHSGAGAESTNNKTDMWSCRWALNDNKIITGDTQINDFTLEPELTADYSNQFVPSTMGVYAHEFGHNLGLPDLYDTNNISEGVGGWSIMGSGSWAGPDMMGDVPVEFDGWSRAFLGWTTPEVVPNGTTVESVPQIEGSGGKVLRLNTSKNNEYFLIENRQKTSYDQFMAGNGLLIWHIDSTIANPNSTYWQDNTVNSTGSYSPPHHGIDVVEADGKNELDSGRNRGDAGDPFPGSSNVRTVKGNSKTEPNLSTWDGQESQLTIAMISNPREVMNATVTVGIAPSVKALTAVPASLNLIRGEVQELSLYATYADGRRQEVGSSVDWKSSNERIVKLQVEEATGSPSVLAVAKGSATITASFGGKRLSIPVKVTPVMVELKANYKNLSLHADKVRAVKVRVIYEDKTTEDVTKLIQWTTEDNAVAKMTTTGIKGVGIGETTITGDYKGDFSVSIKVKVTLPVKRLTVDQKTLNLFNDGVGEINLTAVYSDNSNENVTSAASWSSSRQKIATVENGGIVSAVAKGRTVVKASFSGKTVSTNVIVT